VSALNGNKRGGAGRPTPSREVVVHISSVHDASDTRIYYRECRALSEAGYDVTFLTGDPGIGQAPRQLAYAQVRPISVPQTRAARAILGAWRMRKEALACGARLFHLHDPELLLMVPGLRRNGGKVVYDAHEDLVAQILEKGWIPQRLRVPVSRAVSWLLPRATSRLDAVVAATPDVAELYRTPNVRVVHNFPVLSELTPSPDTVPYRERPLRVAYVGAAITSQRGAHEMVVATKLLARDLPSVELALAGQFLPETLARELSAELPNANLSTRGHLDREGVRQLLGSSRVGLVVEHPISAYLRALPVKMFEYMAAGLPILASDFPLWREVIDSAGCGLLVDPLDPQAIADSLRSLLSDPEASEQMGLRGQEAAKRRFTWSSEAKTLVDLYRELLR
jgi:glycosyltransferase involved in cell wall biosynthesis